MIFSSNKSISTLKLAIALTSFLGLISCEVKNDSALNCDISKLERIVGDQELLKKSDSLCLYFSITERKFLDNPSVHKKYLEKLEYLKTLKLSSLLHPNTIHKHLQPLKTQYSNDSLTQHNSLPAKLILSHEAIHLGDFNQSDTVYREFTLTNTSDRKVNIKRFIHQYINIHCDETVIMPHDMISVGISFSLYLNNCDYLPSITELKENLYISNNSDDTLIPIKITGTLFYPADTTEWYYCASYVSSKFDFYSRLDSGQIIEENPKENVYQIKVTEWNKKRLNENMLLPSKDNYYEWMDITLAFEQAQKALEAEKLREAKRKREEKERRELEQFLKSPKNTYADAERFMRLKCSQINHTFLRGSTTEIGYVFLTTNYPTDKYCISIILKGGTDILSVECHGLNAAVYHWNQITGDYIYL